MKKEEFVRTIRKTGTSLGINIPKEVVSLLALKEDDIVRGLKMGADDYIVKPFSPRQFIARVEAVLRRSRQAPGAGLLRAGDLVLDPERREVRIQDGIPIPLTELENRLLEYLLLHAGHILTIQDLLLYTWGPGGAERDMLRQLVRRLRLKIEPDPSQPTFIETVPGKGYGIQRHPSSSE